MEFQHRCLIIARYYGPSVRVKTFSRKFVLSKSKWRLKLLPVVVLTRNFDFTHPVPYKKSTSRRRNGEIKQIYFMRFDLEFLITS